MECTSGIEEDIEKLSHLDLEGLRAAWRARFGPPPKLRSVALLRLSLAWRIQALRSAGLDPNLCRQLRKRGRIQSEGLELGVGARLRREWQGKVVEVVVHEDGFHLEGKVYRSLSAAATAIAGSRWNGPRFFGLRGTRR